MQRFDGRRQIFLCPLSRALRAGKYPIRVFHLADTYAILISFGLDFIMHSMDEKRNTPENHGAERPKTPVHPGSGILRRAIRGNIVSFPSQIPSFPKGSQAEMQWRMVILFFVRGWRVGKIGERFQVPSHRVWKLLNEWSLRALALGYVQVIDPEAFAACCRDEANCGSDQDIEEPRLAEVRPLIKSGRHALADEAAPGVGPEASGAWDEARAGGGPVDSPGESANLIAALDVAVAHCEEWRGEFWVRTATHLRDLRTAAMAALEVGRSSERSDGFFGTSQGGKSSVSHGLRVRDEERVSHAVA
jgi:hypothetical protein